MSLTSTLMRIFRTTATLALITMGCATSTPPPELANARVAYTRASLGKAPALAPAELHKAQVALDTAEKSFAGNDDSEKTRDLAYVAERKAELAEIVAESAAADSREAAAKQQLEEKQTQIVKETRGELGRTRDQLAEAERARQQQAAETTAERTAREEAQRQAAASEQKANEEAQKAQEAEQRAKEANEALAKLAAKEEARGMVITLSGSVLFRSNESMLMPSAMSRLDEVAEALKLGHSPVTVEGHTDSTGSPATNLILSQHRAEAVRSYLVGRGIPPERIVARGMGSDRPIADNNTGEGRANNRRVEIIVSRDQNPR